MTREEIVEGLKLLEDNMVHFDELQNDKGEWIDVHELLFEAIQALSQEPTVTSTDEPMTIIYPTIACDDAISRDDVYGILMRGYFCDTCSYEEFKERLENLPSVTQKPNYCASCKHNTNNEICLECEYDGITRGMTRYESVTHKSGVEPQESETWNGIHGQITAPKGTFKKIFDDTESGDKE